MRPSSRETDPDVSPIFHTCLTVRDRELGGKFDTFSWLQDEGMTCEGSGHEFLEHSIQSASKCAQVQNLTPNFSGVDSPSPFSVFFLCVCSLREKGSEIFDAMGQGLYLGALRWLWE